MLFRLLIFFLTFLPLISLNSCSDCVHGSGQLHEEERLLPDFDVLQSDLAADILIRPAGDRPGPGIVIRAQQNLMPLILASVENNALKLSSASCYFNAEPVTIIVYTDSLRAIDLGGSGDISCEMTLKSPKTDIVLSGSGNISFPYSGESLNIELAGSGHIMAEGNAQAVKLHLSGSGNLDTKKVVAQTVVAEINGSGNIECFVNEKAEFTLNGSGNILYQGNNTQITTRNNGSGEIRHIQ
jgi:hypothetical protein